ncbi:MAG: transglycosylase SLT domain-containing protein [Phycisphaerales bacterium]|nr:MAG: transglycosylase SLT domain-containing protein [Phycisphaerales bacterium]
MQRKCWPFFLVVSLMLCFTPVARCGNNASSRDLERLLDAIAQIESNNRTKAVGDKGRAIGVYQIHRAYWKDGTRILGVKWSYRDAFDPGKARRVVRAYLRHYGRGKSLIQMARIHNGGPRGYRKRATLGYGRKIQNILRRARN